MSSVPIACGGGGSGEGTTWNGPSDSVETAITEVPCPVSQQ